MCHLLYQRFVGLGGGDILGVVRVLVYCSGGDLVVVVHGVVVVHNFSDGITDFHHTLPDVLGGGELS